MHRGGGTIKCKTLNNLTRKVFNPTLHICILLLTPRARFGLQQAGFEHFVPAAHKRAGSGNEIALYFNVKSHVAAYADLDVFGSDFLGPWADGPMGITLAEPWILACSPTTRAPG